MYAVVGRVDRYEENSKRSMTGTSSVSDSFLKPVMNKGELRRVSDVVIIGEVYVRIAGRDDVDRVSLDGLRIVNVTMKLPKVREREDSVTNLFRDCFLCAVIRVQRRLRKADRSAYLFQRDLRFPMVAHSGYIVNTQS